VRIPSGVAHAVSSAGPGPVRFLALHTPSRGYGAFLQALRDTNDESVAAAQAGSDQEPESEPIP